MYPFNPDERNIYADSFDHDIRLDTKEGQQVVDFVQELAIENNYTPVVHQILSYLTPKDLTSCSCVNKSWKRVVQSDTTSSHRKKAYLKELRDRKARIGKENFLPTQYLSNRTPLNGIDSKPSLINRQKLFVKKRNESDENNSILKIPKKEILKTKKNEKKKREYSVSNHNVQMKYIYIFMYNIYLYIYSHKHFDTNSNRIDLKLYSLIEFVHEVLLGSHAKENVCSADFQIHSPVVSVRHYFNSIQFSFVKSL